MHEITNNISSLNACNPALNATVSASAGSGKTWLLITRIVRLLINGAEPSNIIALTFTKKAAAEMQTRLSQRLFEITTADDEALNKILTEIGSDTNANTKIVARGLYEKLIHNLYPIRIQTFHSFCQDILARFPLEADIPPGFELIEDSSLLERQAWQELFNLAAKRNRNDSSTLSDSLDMIMQACNGPKNTQTALHNFLSHRSDWWAYTNQTNKPVDFAITELKRSLQLKNNLEDPSKLFFTEKNQGKLKIFSNFLRDTKGKKNEAHAITIDNSLNKFSHHDTNEKIIFENIKTAFIKKDGETLIQGRKYTDALEKKLGQENANVFIDLHTELASKIQNINEQLKRLFTLKINKAWYLCGHQFVEIFQQLKKDMRLLDFNDLEWKCYKLLQYSDNTHWVQYKIDQRIDHLLIDEFQDTNPTQWNLLSPILEEIAANPEERERSVFLVGDEKQSIYSFRRANPALQAQASTWLKNNLNAQATPLDFSRRSSPAIIHCVNKIFEQENIKKIMTGFITHDTHLTSLPGQVHLYELFTNTNENEEQSTTDHSICFRNPLKQSREHSSKTVRHNEAENIAKKILQLKNNPEFITENENARPVQYGDIILLTRNRTHIGIYEEAFKNHDIPFISSNKGGLLDNLEIQDLSCLLNTLIAPYNNLSLAQVLKSPIFNASDNDLIQLQQLGKKYWYQSLINPQTTTKKEGTDKQISFSQSLKRAAKLLPHWKILAENLPVHDCLDKIFSEGNIIERYISANKPENQLKVAANCQRFLELSLEIDSGRYPSIARFLQRLNHINNYSDSPPSEPLPKGDSSRVSIMTIHASKGLEAPIIFLADCNSTPSKSNAYSSLVRWPADKTRPNIFQLQLSKNKTDNVTLNHQKEILKEQAREELNLLYVALTRAREQLHISGNESKKRHTENSWYQLISNGLDETATVSDNDSVNCKIFSHLSYNHTHLTRHMEASPKENDETVVNKELLKPIHTLSSPPLMISPSSLINEERQAGVVNTRFNQKENSALIQTNIAQWKGVLIHRAIELLCKNKTYPVSKKSINYITSLLSSELSLKKPRFLKYLNACIDEAVSTYNHPELQHIFNPPKTCKTYDEIPIMYKRESKAVYGIADRIIKTGNEIAIIDYKSHILESDKTISEDAKIFIKQLHYYRDGAKKIWPKCTIKTGVLFTHYKKIVWLE